MTAVALPHQNLNRQPWSAEGTTTNGAFMPRKSAQRTNSSSSLSSQASATSTISAASSQSNAVVPANSTAADPAWAARKTKAPKGLWPTTKTEPIAGISTARPQPIASAGPGSSAASAMSALQTPAPMVPSQHNGAVQAQQQNGAPRPQGPEQPAVLHLVPMNGTFERKTITVPFFPDVLRIGRQTNNKTIPTPLNGYFDSKVLSRQHAEVWADRNGKIWIRDVKSSNGTFVNGSRLSQENRDSEPHELREQDMLELGIDIVSEDQKTIVHHKVAARVEHAGIYARSAGDMMDLNFGELENSHLSNMMGPNGQQQLANMRGRAPSNGSMNGQRMQGPGAIGGYANNMQQPRHPNFWLQPITMEQVVKKLNAEIKAAKQQSQELQQTHQYINAILTSDPKKEPTRSSPVDPTKISPIKDIGLKARFSEPPAPPPQQPLPAKPDAASSLRKSDTERPKLGSPVRSDAQMSTLTEALTSAKKEIESQSVRLRDLEAMLTEERRAREDAEERAARLERESSKELQEEESQYANGDVEERASEPEEAQNTGLENGSALPDATNATSRLQQRLELMMTEMSEIKQQMERYRERAETAEADRKSLAEMIESIRRDNARSSSRETSRRSRSNSDPSRELDQAGNDGSEDDHEAEEGEIMIIKDEDLDNDGTGDIIRRAQMPNGHAVENGTEKSSTKSPNLLVTQQHGSSNLMYHGGPVGAMVAVVAIGVAIMAMLNQYPKVER
ncbi:hypothetical protein BDU57DRAFT_558681 [Ampelomyces quisqualis]|uniref:FHA domain-containing protein n=1 Tax=Ampelomyces quisqualis TaxID=50730 RepID=A0A6A5QG54_AMPQU|nr:hypothetical protein BDU57DRAFT_558681 [Ampelomyces quisqualis]